MTDLPARTDVAIIGGGLAGCATAWALASRGIEAVVLEAETELGRYASGRGAGLGRQLAEDDATTTLTIRGAAVLRTELAAAWTPCGGILSFDDEARAETYAARARAHGVDAQRLDRDGVLAHWPALVELAVTSGLAIASDGVIDLRTLLAAYARASRVVLDARVTGVAPQGRGVIVSTSRGPVEARRVVDAAGAWAGATTADPPLAAFKRHVHVIEAVPPDAAPYLWHLGREELYVRAEAGGVLASICDETQGQAADVQPDASAEVELRGRLGRTAPSIAAAPLRRQWACQRSFTPDRQMKLGRDPTRPWLFWAAALGGHGATASAAVGGLVADAVIASLSAT